MKILSILALVCITAFAQLTPIPNTDFPTFRTNLNNSLANGVAITGSYVNPSWLVSIPSSKVTGLPVASVTCLGTGTDQIAINAAITTINGYPHGGTVTVSPVTPCTLTAPVQGKNNVRLDSFSLIQTTANTPAVNAGGTTNFSLTNMLIIGGQVALNNSPNETVGFSMTGSTITNLTNANSPTYPAYVAFYNTYTASNLTLVNNTFDTVGLGAYLYIIHGSKITGNRFLHIGNAVTQNDAIYFNNPATSPTDGFASYGNIVTGNSMIDGRRMFIEMQGCYSDQTIITGNTATQWNAATDASNSFGISFGGTCFGPLISGNSLTGSQSGNVYGIETGGPGSIVIGNEVSGFGTDIVSTGGGNCNIANNTTHGGTTGINILAANTQSCTISNNHVLEPVSNGIILSNNACAGCTVNNNDITRTPAGSDSGVFLAIQAGTSATPRVINANTFTLASGTFPGGFAAWIGYAANGNAPGSTWRDNIYTNLNGSVPSFAYGFNCVSATELDGNVVTGSVLHNLAAGIGCPVTTTIQYADNAKQAGSTPLGFGMVGSNMANLGGIRAVTTTTDTILAADCNKEVTYNNASPIAVSLPQASSAFFPAPCSLQVVNLGAGTVTFTGVTSTINLSATLPFTSKAGGIITSDGANYAAVTGSGGGGSGTVTVVGSGNLTSTACMTGGGSQTAQTPSALCAVDSSGNIQAVLGTFSSGIASGTSPPALTAGTGGAQILTEGTAPSVGPASGVDVCYADSTQHGILCSTNNRPYSNTGTRAIAFAVGDPGGSAITAGSTATAYVTVPFACSITAWNLLVDAGTVTVKFWKIATGTAIPTVTQSINTSGVAISTGTAIHSTTLSDFTTTTVTANDIVAMNVATVATAKYVQGVLQCNQ